jgi:hypothetical protein
VLAGKVIGVTVSSWLPVIVDAEADDVVNDELELVEEEVVVVVVNEATCISTTLEPAPLLKITTTWYAPTASNVSLNVPLAVPVLEVVP